MRKHIVGDSDKLREDLFKLFIHCFLDNKLFPIDGIDSKEMFDLLTSWRYPLWDLFPREIHNEGFEWYIDEEMLHLIDTQGFTVIEGYYNDNDPDMLKFPVKVRIARV